MRLTLPLVAAYAAVSELQLWAFAQERESERVYLKLMPSSRMRIGRTALNELIAFIKKGVRSTVADLYRTQGALSPLQAPDVEMLGPPRGAGGGGAGGAAEHPLRFQQKAEASADDDVSNVVTPVSVPATINEEALAAGPTKETSTDANGGVLAPVVQPVVALIQRHDPGTQTAAAKVDTDIPPAFQSVSETAATSTSPPGGTIVTEDPTVLDGPIAAPPSVFSRLGQDAIYFYSG